MIFSELSTTLADGPIAENARASIDRFDRAIMNVNKTIMLLQM